MVYQFFNHAQTKDRLLTCIVEKAREDWAILFSTRRKAANERNRNISTVARSVFNHNCAHTGPVGEREIPYGWGAEFPGPNAIPLHALTGISEAPMRNWMESTRK